MADARVPNAREANVAIFMKENMLEEIKRERRVGVEIAEALRVRNAGLLSQGFILLESHRDDACLLVEPDRAAA